jgi:alkylation response protein AidB-like acyl-CoA dehydrogenase
MAINPATQSKEHMARTIAALSERFRERAADHDAAGTFPYENFAELRASGYPALTVPERYGGMGATMLDAVRLQERLGMGDGSTALAITMHVQTIGAGASGEGWNPALFESLCREIVERGVLVNSCATEPEMGSPSRGGKPATTATRVPGGWRINGHKTFASMSPVLDYFIVPATPDGRDEIARFLIPRSDGVQIRETWDSVGMRSTGSHDLILHDVFVPDSALISQNPITLPDPTQLRLNAWFTLTVSAVYLGVAAAAHETALDFARTRTPSGLGRPIATLESIQRRIGEAEVTLQSARAVLYHTAEEWDRRPDERGTMGAALAIAKLTVTNAAIKVVDDAMRVVGGVSMTHQTPLERYYRDVRAGLFHPPFDDGVLPLLGRVALNRP